MGPELLPSDASGPEQQEEVQKCRIHSLGRMVVKSGHRASPSVLSLVLVGRAVGSVTSWEIDGETVETVSDFIILGSKITE